MLFRSQDLKFDDQDAADLKRELKEAKDRGVSIKIISTCHADVTSFMTCQGLNEEAFGTKIISDLMIIDDKELFLMGSPMPMMKNQIAFEFSHAPSIIYDVNAFFELGWYMNVSKYESAHYPHKLMVNHNTLYPHNLKNLGNVSFIQSDVKKAIPPIRETLTSALKNVFKGKTKSIKYFGTRFDQHLGKESSFQFQTIFATVASKGNVKIMLPVNEPEINTSLKWLSTIAATKNIEIRLTEENFTNNFIIADDYLLFGSHPFSDNMLYKSYGLELFIENFVDLQKFNDLFDEYWNAAKPFSDYIDWIWN